MVFIKLDSHISLAVICLLSQAEILFVRPSSLNVLSRMLSWGTPISLVLCGDEKHLQIKWLYWGNSNPCKASLLLHTQMGTWVQYRKTSGGGCAIKECRYQNIKAWKVQRIISMWLNLQQEYSCWRKKKRKKKRLAVSVTLWS